MSKTLDSRYWVEYSLANMKIIGFVEYSGDGLYWFNDLDGLRRNRRDLLIDHTEIRVLPLEMHKEDIESMIDLALQTNDKEWFNELNIRLEEYELGFFDRIALENTQAKNNFMS